MSSQTKVANSLNEDSNIATDFEGDNGDSMVTRINKTLFQTILVYMCRN